MAYFRVTLVNLSGWFLSEYMGKQSMSLAKFFHTVLLMPAEIELTKDVRRIKLKCNPKDPGGMAVLEPALQKLNDLRFQHLDERRIEFAI